MIEKDQVYEIILTACPSFQPIFDECDDKDLQYIVMGELADHLLELYNKNDTQEFSAICKEIDRLILEGDQYVSELAVIGFLEGIQNGWSHTIDPELFYPFLYPESKKWWKELNDFWAGKIPVVGAGLQNDDED